MIFITHDYRHSVRGMVKAAWIFWKQGAETFRILLAMPQESKKVDP
jgi:formate/nitrite transporter FocA (FNT family)